MATAHGVAEESDVTVTKQQGQLPHMGFQGGTVVKNPPVNAGYTRDVGSIPGSGRSPGVGNGNPLQYSSLENSMNRGAWQATAQGGHN